MKLAFVCPTASGHLNPSLGLASELQSRGHEVCLAVMRDGEAKAAAAGIRHCVVGEDEFPRGEVAQQIDKMGRLTGFAAFRGACEFLQREHLAHIRDLPRVCEAERFDGLVIDQGSCGAATVAQTLGIPYVMARSSKSAIRKSLIKYSGYQLRNNESICLVAAPGHSTSK